MAAKAILVWVNLGLILALLARITAFKFDVVFRLFQAVLALEFVFLGLTTAMSVEGSWVRYHLDYRVVFAVGVTLDLVLTACIIFALLRSYMSNHTGILSLSRKILSAVVLAAIALGLIVVLVQMRLDKRIESIRVDTPESLKKRDAERKELQKANVEPLSPINASRLRHVVFVTDTVDQAVSAFLLITLLCMLVFLLWFPVTVPQNTVLFSAGYLVFLSIKTLTLFSRYLSLHTMPAISVSIQVISALCCLYWLVFLTRAGQTVPVRLGHSWKPEEQERLIVQLDAINAALLRSAQRSKSGAVLG
jgi:hypothetical protein